ncbi:MAG: CoA transferase, partial [Thermodesulfobacteriota bacterium]
MPREGDGGANRRESALGGVRVLDLTDLSGALCARLLGDLGADVVRVEP